MGAISGPVNELLKRAIKLVSVRLNRLGTVPCKLLFETSSVVKLVSRLIAGRTPVRLLFDKLNTLRLVSKPMDVGIVVKLLFSIDLQGF